MDSASSSGRKHSLPEMLPHCLEGFFPGQLLCRIYIVRCQFFLNGSLKRAEKQHEEGTLLRMLGHVRRGVKGEPGASSESHPFDVESYVFIWPAHWLRVTVLPAASAPRISGLSEIQLFFLLFLQPVSLARLVRGLFSVFTIVFLLEQEVRVSLGSQFSTASLSWFISIRNK